MQKLLIIITHDKINYTIISIVVFGKILLEPYVYEYNWISGEGDE